MNVNIVPAQTTSEAVYYTASRHFLDVQFATMDVLDNKSAQYFSVGSTVLTVTFALLNLSQRDVPTYALWALGAALVSYVFLLVFSFFMSLIRGLEYRPILRHSSNTVRKSVAISSSSGFPTSISPRSRRISQS